VQTTLKIVRYFTGKILNVQKTNKLNTAHFSFEKLKDLWVTTSQSAEK